MRPKGQQVLRDNHRQSIQEKKTKYMYDKCPQRRKPKQWKRTITEMCNSRILLEIKKIILKSHTERAQGMSRSIYSEQPTPRHILQVQLSLYKIRLTKQIVSQLT